MNLGRYQLMGKLASGGMAEVYLAKAAGPMGFEKKLVVKRILPHLAEDESFIEMFFAEARLVAKLDHPNIVQIFDFGEADGSYFLAMEYVDGLNLRVLLKRVLAARERLPVALCAKIISAACEGLAYAHEFADPDTRTPLHLVHRDISPDNILVSTHGAVKLADFGIAKAANQLHRTQTGIVKGKVAYMPSEQLQGKSLDARTDIFALGVVLYELLSGRRPFEAENETGLMLAILHEEPVPVTRHREDVPPRMQQILARTLAKERDARYANCRELQMDLERYLRTVDEPVGPVDISRCVARFSSLGAAEANKTPNAKLLLETPSAPSLAAPASTRVSSSSRERTRQGNDTGSPAKVPTLVEEPLTVGDSTRTDPAQPRARGGSPSRWTGRVVLGVSVLALASAGYGFWRVTRPAPAPVSSVAQVESASTRPENPARPEAEASPSPTPPVPVPSPPDPDPEKKASASAEPQPAPATAPKPSEPEPPSSAAPLPVSFRVESNLPGSVRVGGKPFGSTPADVKGLTPGRVSVEVFDKQQGFSKKQTFELKPGDNGVLRFTIGKGRLSFLVLPYATVVLDGKTLGDTPLPPVEVYEGRHVIKLINDKQGAPVTREFVVKPGDNPFMFNYNAPR
ncbi:serine/threonine protein kinase [Cystobacter fuscus]|nr:serine/threonine protein kinase [Cystobacter fuscus]